MKLYFASVVVLLTFIALSLAADEARSSPPKTETAGEWIDLFDGKKTDAWRAWNGERFPEKGWIVEDGCLKCQKGNGRPNGGGGDLVTRAEFTDFELHWEWKISQGGNSGVKYLLGKRGDQKGPLYQGDKGLDYYGHEYQLLDDDNHPDAKKGPIRQSGAFYDVIPPNADKRVHPVGEFNESRLLIRGNHVEHWLNSVKVVEYDLGSPEVVAGVEKSKYKGLPGFDIKHKSAILLQDHGNEIWFRNIRIRALDAAVAK